MRLSEFLPLIDTAFIAMGSNEIAAPRHECEMDPVTGMCKTCCVEMTELCPTCLARGHHSFWCPVLLVDQAEVRSLTGGQR